MNSRRSVLRILGFTPLASKVAADKAIADLAGLSMANVGYVSGPSLSGGEPQTSSAGAWKAKVLRFLASSRLPQWAEDELHNRWRQVTSLDPDIASKKAWSMNVKIAAQRQRNIERARREMLEGPRRGLLQREFEERYGVWL